MLHAERAGAFQERARRGQVCVGVHSSAMSPQLVELYGLVEVDFVIIGAEVESLDPSRMEDMIRAADASGTVPIVKLPRPDLQLMGQVLNSGVPMVMVPHVTTRPQLEELIRGSRFEPVGLRGVCPVARYNGYGSRFLSVQSDLANTAHSVIPIIEDAEALDHLDELMAVEEVDIFEIGPYDLSATLGERGQGFRGPKTMAAIEQICDAARDRGKAVMAPVWHTLEADSYPAIYQHQMDHMIARGINCLYEIETVFLSMHMTRMGLLRNVREVTDDEPAEAAPRRNGVAARTRKRAKTASKRGARRDRRPA